MKVGADSGANLVDRTRKKWIRAKLTQQGILTGSLIKKKTTWFATQLGVEGAKASDGFLSKFKERNGLLLKLLHGEASSVDIQIVKTFKAKLDGICSQYKPGNIYNSDERKRHLCACQLEHSIMIV